MPATERTTPTMGRAIRRGLAGRCPRCGEGNLFKGFLEQVETCSVCGEQLGQVNVGLLLPFVVITIVVHVIIFVMLEMELSGRSSLLVYLVVLVPLSVIVPLLLIRPAKGGLIGFMWKWKISDELER